MRNVIYSWPFLSNESALSALYWCCILAISVHFFFILIIAFFFLSHNSGFIYHICNVIIWTFHNFNKIQRNCCPRPHRNIIHPWCHPDMWTLVCIMVLKTERFTTLMSVKLASPWLSKTGALGSFETEIN